MSTRGINFLDQWIANNVPETSKADVISVDELTNQLLNDAGAVGIKRIEIDEEVDSLYRTILDAIVLRPRPARVTPDTPGNISPFCFFGIVAS